MEIPVKREAPEDDIYSYYVTSVVKPTAVTDALTLNLLEPHFPCLVLAKTTHLDIFKGQGLDSLVVLLQDMQFFVLTMNLSSNTLETNTSGDFFNPSTPALELGPFVEVDPESRIIVLAMYPGQMKVLQIHGDTFDEEYLTTRFEALEVLSMTMLYNCPEPTVAVLSQKADTQHVSLHRFVKNTHFEDLNSLWSTTLVDKIPQTAYKLFAVPQTDQGCLLFGDDVVIYANSQRHYAASIPCSMIGGVVSPDTTSNNVVIADSVTGEIALLVLESEKSVVQRIIYEPFGNTTAASCLAYLDNDVFFVGSAQGDSQVVAVKSIDGHNMLSILDEHTNIGSITDIQILEKELFGQPRIVTASGTSRNGSLRIIQHGISISNAASVDLEDLQRIFSLRRQTLGPNGPIEEHCLAMVFTHGISFLQFEGEELTGLAVPGAPEGPAMLCRNVVHNQWLIVTESCAALLSSDGLVRVDSYLPEQVGGTFFGTAACTSEQLCLSYGQKVSYLEICNGEMRCVHTKDVAFEFTCMDTNPSKSLAERSNWLLASTWNRDAVLFDLTTLSQKLLVPLNSDVIATSCTMIQAHGCDYALFGMGDGFVLLYTINFEKVVLEGCRRIHVGNQPVSLTPFLHPENHGVFCLSGTAFMFQPDKHRASFVTVNQPNIQCITTIDTLAFPSGVVYYAENQLIIGQMQQIDKLKISKVPLGYSPVAMTYLDEQNTLIVCGHSSEGLQSIIQAYDAKLDILSSLMLEDNELVNCVIQHSFPNDNTKYFIIGTAFVIMDEIEPSKGRIILCSFEHEIRIMYDLITEGSVNTITTLHGHLLAGINDQVAYFMLSDPNEAGQRTLDKRNMHSLHAIISSIVLSIREISDISTDYKYHSHQTSLVPYVEWTTSCSLLPDNNQFLVAMQNSTLAHYKFEPNGVEPREESVVISHLYLGSAVNVLRRGSLVKPAQPQSFIAGTLAGGLYALIPLDKSTFELLKALESKLLSYFPCVGNLSHTRFRCTTSNSSPDYTMIPPMVDGDLVERFVELSIDQKEKVCKNLLAATESGMPDVPTVSHVSSIIEKFLELN
eukprot:gene11048-3117_t